MEKKEQKEVFLREATGLVRSGGTWSTFAFNWIFTGNSIGIIGASLLFAYPLVAPGANWLALVALATLTGAIVVLTYGFFSIIMPRAGGDYVCVGRTIHPALGFASSFSWAAWLAIVFGWAGKNIGPVALQAALGTWGAITGNSSYSNIASSLTEPNNLFIIGTITIVIFGLIALIPIKSYFRLQNIAFVFMLITLAITLGTFFLNSPSSFSSALDKVVAPNTYNGIVNATTQPGLIPANSLQGNIAGWAEWEGFAIFAMGSAFIGSEIKNVKKSQIVGTVVSELVLGATFFVSLLALVSAVGSNFLYGAAYTYGTSSYTLPFPPYYSSFVILLANNPILVLLFTIGFVLGGLWFMEQNIIMFTRITLAWSFDRVTPSIFGRVSQRFRTPTWGLLLAVIIGEAALAVYVYTTWLGLFSQLLALAISEVITGIAAIILPYKKKDLFESSGVNYRIGGIPVLSLLGVGTVATLLVFIYINVTDSSLGANNPVSLYLITSVFILGFVCYFIASFLRKRQGLNLAQIFKEIPPE